MLLAFAGVVGLIFGLIAILKVTYDPVYFSNRLGQSVISFSSSQPKAWSAIQAWERDEGTEVFGFALFTTAIASTAYRRGEKWAWYVLWYLPFYMAYGTFNTIGFRLPTIPIRLPPSSLPCRPHATIPEFLPEAHRIVKRPYFRGRAIASDI